MNDRVFVVKYNLDEGWHIIERDASDIVAVSKDCYALKTFDDDSIYSKEQIFKDLDHAIAYLNSDYLYAIDGRYFI